MNILFDPKSSQLQVQEETSARLNSLFGAIESEGWVKGGTGGTWAQEILIDPISNLPGGKGNVLVILTRYPFTVPGSTPAFPPSTDFSYLTSEISAIQSFVEAGGGLLLMSNHGSSPSESANWSQYDQALAAAFNVTLLPAYFVVAGNEFMTFSGGLLNNDLSSTLLNQVSSIVVHDCCGVSVQQGTDFTPIAELPLNTTDTSGNNYSPVGQYFGVTLEYGKGQVIILGNSGWVADDGGCPCPAPGLLPQGSNMTFLLNCLKVLGGAPLVQTLTCADLEGGIFGK
jgi:hypothetical protein